MGPEYMGWGGMWGFPWMMILVAVMVVFCLLFFGRRPGGWGCGSDDRGGAPPRETPLEILKRRYAAGEITREAFERMKGDIA